MYIHLENSPDIFYKNIALQVMRKSILHLET